MSNYHIYIAGPDWKRRRDAYLDSVQHRCEECSLPAKNMNVHHLTYERLGSELDTDLVALCRACHRETHGLTAQSRSRVGNLRRQDHERTAHRGFGNI